MKIINFFKNNINKYSFQSIVWFFWLFIGFILTVIYLCYLSFNILNIDSLYDFQSVLWLLLVFIPTAFLPITIYVIGLIYLFFKEKEKLSPDFLIKNKTLTTNSLYLSICIISFLLEMVFIILSLYWAIRLFVIDIENMLLLLFCLPIIIVISLIYLLARKIFIHKKSNP